MGRKCGVEGCLSDSNRPEDTGVTFHKVPMHNDIRPKWMQLCRIPDDKKTQKVIYICSRHFLRVDFCNFKGKKYMLRQGVLPSVFPWDKSKLEAIKGNLKPDSDTKSGMKQEVLSEEDNIDANSVENTKPKEEPADVKTESNEATESVKNEDAAKQDVKPKTGSKINFGVNSRIEALDNNVWYPATVVEEDDEENEVLIHFEKFSSKHDEWICKDSPRLRPYQTDSGPTTSTTPVKANSSSEQYVVGERCHASWSDARKFPATVTKVLPNDTYEVLFDDGFVKNLKAHRMCKAEGRPMQSSPLFDPIKSTKQERRDKKRKINIAQLFGKRPRLDNTEQPKPSVEKMSLYPDPNTNPDAIFEPWVPEWANGMPVGIESSIETNDGTRKSTIVPDPRLPKGWSKHLTQRIHGASAGKWDTIIVSPENRRFRSRSEVKLYLEENKMMKYNWTMFDFSIHRSRSRPKQKNVETESARRQSQSSEPVVETFEQEEIIEPPPEEEENKNLLKIPVVDDGYQCPIEGCGKTYRRENLAQMHVKHYHPEYTKFLDSTPNVADLAYARTVGESLDKSPGVKTPSSKASVKSAAAPKTPSTKLPQSPQIESETKPQSPQPNTATKSKDSEIIKLLNTKPFDMKKEEPIRPLPSGLPSRIPNREDLNLRTLSTTRPPAGIKTLLPVVRPENKQEERFSEYSSFKSRSNVKRKRGFIETVDASKGGQVIKIVRMKQEEIINCTCGFTEEDGLMIQCDLCLCWQHAFCNNIERESQVPEKYVCYICQNPAKQRMSKKYFHDQDWVKHGVLATTNFHSKDEEALLKRYEKLKKSHDVSGGLFELKDFIHTLKVKLKIAEAKDHPKLYLWSKPWEKLPLPEKMNDDIHLKIKQEKLEEKADQSDSMLMMILKGGKDEVKNEVENKMQIQAPIIPQPEAAIDSNDCRLNLLEHISHAQNLVEERLDDFEKQIDELEDLVGYEEDEDYPKTRQTISMLLKDLNTLQELSTLTTL